MHSSYSWFRYVLTLSVIIMLLLSAVPHQPLSVATPVRAQTIPTAGYYYLNFTEAGLPNETLWYVTVNGTVHSNSNEGVMTPYITLTLAADKYYNYSVSGPEGFNATPSSGNLLLSGNESIPVSFKQTGPPFSVTFEEVGLTLSYYKVTPSGMEPVQLNWSVTFDGRELTSTNDTITFTGVDNGTYPWVVDSSNVSTGPGTYYAPEVVSGNLAVPSQLTVVVKYDQYSRVLVAPDDPEFGSTSPSGWHWYRVSPVPTTIDISAVPLNGSYFTGWTFSGVEMVANYSAENTTMTVYGAGAETANFVTRVTFQANGLPQGQTGSPWWWHLKVYPESAGEEVGTSPSNVGSYSPLYAYGNDSVTFYATNGTYRYVISDADVNGTYYSPEVMNGTIDVQGPSPTYYVTFKQGVPVNFNETGLPAGTRWSIDINGTTYDFYAGAVNPTVYLPPYTSLSYSVSPVVGYDVQDQSGTMSFPLGPSNYTVNFYPARPEGEVHSEYTGYFYSGMSVNNVFGFNGSWGSAAPVSVYGQIGSYPVGFSPTPSGTWASNQFDMGLLGSNATLEVHAEYANGSILNYTYPVQVIRSPWWLTNLSSSDLVTMSISQPYQQWNNSYCINFTSVLDTGSQLTVNVDAGLVSGSYQVVPNIPFTLTLSSAGTAELSSTINPGEISVNLGSATVQVSGSFSIDGSFAASQGTLVWESASVELKMDTMAQTSVPLASVGIPGTDMNVGFNLQVGFGPDFTLILHLVPASNGQYEITPGVPIEAANATIGLGATISLYVNAQVKEGIDWASIAGGGSLTFMQYVSTPPFIDLGGDLTGTVSIKATIVDVQYTVWSTSGTIYTWGDSPGSIVQQRHGGIRPDVLQRERLQLAHVDQRLLERPRGHRRVPDDIDLDRARPVGRLPVLHLLQRLGADGQPALGRGARGGPGQERLPCADAVLRALSIVQPAGFRAPQRVPPPALGRRPLRRGQRVQRVVDRQDTRAGVDPGERRVVVPVQRDLLGRRERLLVQRRPRAGRRRPQRLLLQRHVDHGVRAGEREPARRRARAERLQHRLLQPGPLARDTEVRQLQLRDAGPGNGIALPAEAAGQRDNGAGRDRRELVDPVLRGDDFELGRRVLPVQCLHGSARVLPGGAAGRISGDVHLRRRVALGARHEG
ncbi:MAG: hypothetical protein ACP5RJ_07430 [Conexivisphaera sp.]